MKRFLAVLLLACSSAFAQVMLPSEPPVDPTKELRVCGVPERDEEGKIARSTAVLNAYRKIHPCPVTGKSYGACPGWAINHVIPLAKGGCDSVINLQWLPVQIKSCSSEYCIDRWERTYYGDPHGIVKFKE